MRVVLMGRCSTCDRADGKSRGARLIEASGLTKRYGEKVAVRDLTFTVRPGVVTGFLGPNGSGSRRRCG
jgi:ABC-type transporter Mla maintaining outer membrane lipid asymmetry ATPase subunit MlaF